MAPTDRELRTCSKISIINFNLVESTKVFKGDGQPGVPAQRQVSSGNGNTENDECMCRHVISQIPQCHCPSYPVKDLIESPEQSAAQPVVTLYAIQSSLEGLLQSGEWTNIKLASTAGFTYTITLCVWCVGLFFCVWPTPCGHLSVNAVHVEVFWRPNSWCSKGLPLLSLFKNIQKTVKKICFTCCVPTNMHQQAWDDKLQHIHIDCCVTFQVNHLRLNSCDITALTTAGSTAAAVYAAA